MTDHYIIHLESKYENMKLAYLRKLDSGYFDRHPDEQREAVEQLANAFGNLLKEKELLPAVNRNQFVNKLSHFGAPLSKRLLGVSTLRN